MKEGRNIEIRLGPGALWTGEAWLLASAGEVRRSGRGVRRGQMREICVGRVIEAAAISGFKFARVSESGMKLRVTEEA